MSQKQGDKEEKRKWKKIRKMKGMSFVLAIGCCKAFTPLAEPRQLVL